MHSYTIIHFIFNPDTRVIYLVDEDDLSRPVSKAYSINPSWEKIFKGESCFVLKKDPVPESLKAWMWEQIRNDLILVD